MEKSFIVDLWFLYMIKYLIKGKITNVKGNPINNLSLQAMDSDQEWFEDHNDDLLGSSSSDSVGSFEITFDDSTFNDSWLEKKPEIYLMVRNEIGQIIHRSATVKIKSDDKANGTINIPINITLDSIEKKTDLTSTDLYWNNDRILAAFVSVGDTITLRNSDFERNFRLLISSINAWLIYTNDGIWNKIGYDGPQVPRYPLQSPKHTHKLSWEKRN
jgi:hypothetical protein